MTESLMWIYNAIGICIPFVALLAVMQLMVVVVRWRTDSRADCVKRFGLLLTISVLLPLIQMTLWLQVIRPRMAGKLLSEIRLRESEYLDQTSLIKKGDVVPEFSVSTTDDELISIPATGQVVLVNFFATWCGPCKVELPHLQKIWEENRSNSKFKMIVIGRGESRESVAKFQKEYGLTLPMAADPEGLIFSQFAKERIPRTYIVGPDGRAEFVKLGFREEEADKIRSAVQDAMSSLTSYSQKSVVP